MHDIKYVTTNFTDLNKTYRYSQKQYSNTGIFLSDGPVDGFWFEEIVMLLKNQILFRRLDSPFVY